MRNISFRAISPAVVAVLLASVAACGGEGSPAASSAPASTPAQASGAIPTVQSVTSGWFDPAPSADSRIVYASSSQGDDGNDGMSEQTPLKSIAAGIALLRDGYPDRLLLKAGDVWNETIRSWKRSGRSDTEPMVIASYGPGPRPLLNTNGNIGFEKWAMDRRTAVAVLGLDFYNNTADPSSPDYDPAADQAIGFRWVGDGNAIHVEDCRFRFFGTALILQKSTGTDLSDVRVRRCQILDSYSTDSHSQGLYAAGVNGLLVEENLLDHNGWNEQVPGAEATMFNHNAYLSSCSNVAVRGNLILRASSMGIKFRSDVTGGSYGLHVENNLFVEGEIGISVGGNTAEPIRFSNVTVRNNVFLHIGRSNPTGRNFAWALEVRDVMNGSFEDNHFLHQPLWGNSYAIGMFGGSNSDLSLARNVIFRYRGKAFRVVSKDGWQNNTISENLLQDPDGNSHLIEHEGTLDRVAYAGNTYHNSMPSRIARLDFVGLSFGEWVSRTGEAGATEAKLSFTDPYRDVATYHASKGGVNSFAAFIEAARLQDRSGWGQEYMAEAVNDYLRAGFETP